MPPEYTTLVTIALYLWAIVVVFAVRWRTIRYRQQMFALRFEWDGPISAMLLLLTALWFCTAHPGDWARIIPTAFPIAIFLATDFYSKHKKTSTSTKDKDTPWNS